MKRPTAQEVEREILALDTLDLTVLRERWLQLYRHPAPKNFRRDLLIRGLAYQVQVKAFGGLSPKTHKLLLKLAAAAEAGSFDASIAPRRLRTGTRLVRAWKGVTHTVNVLENGFEWRGNHYRSLSAIAGEIAGTNWNGPKFFGLKARKARETSRAEIGENA